MSSQDRIRLSTKHTVIPLLIFALGAIVAVYTWVTDPARFWPNLLLDGFYVTTLTLAAVFFLATQRVTNARWSAGIRRVPEALMAALPLAVVPLLIVLLLGRQWLYPWARPGAFAHESALAGKVHYLAAPWVYVRPVLSIGLWIAFAFLFRSTSQAQDRRPGLALDYHRRLNQLGVAFVIVFAFTFTFSAYDFLISLDPSWFSTMFAVYVFAGTFVQGIAAVTLATVFLRERGYLRGVAGEKQFHDLGKMMFAFSIFWGYIWTCQYLLIWYTNIPEEVTHYIARTNGGWVYLFALNFILNWVVPFTALLSARAKTTFRTLKLIAVVVLIGHWLDLYLIIMPTLWPDLKIGIFEIVPAAGWVALIYAFFVQMLARAPLVPVNDPVLRAEELLHEHAHGHLHAASPGIAHQHAGGERP
jgi:hypothetical protein